MENYENEELRQEPEYTPPQPRQEEPQPYPEQPAAPQTYSGAGVGRKESPFADSPYVMNHNQTQYQYQRPTYVPPMPPEQPPVKKPREKKTRNGRGLRTALCIVLALAVVAGSCGITAALVNNRWESRTQLMQQDFETRLDTMQQQIDAASQAAANAAAGNSVSGSPVATNGSLTPGQVYAQNVDSVVLISCEVRSNFYGQSTTGMSTGSGFVLTEDGYVVTNNHVVEGATSVKVTTYDGKEYTAQVIGTDSTNDVAVLKADSADALSPVTLGSSSDLIVGDQVVAIGNPLGELTSTMTVGYVSAKDRDVTTDGTTINMIQTDAAINSGNSGGPLFNMKGEVVGITTAKDSGASSSGATIESIGFAIPMDDVIGMIDDLVNFGYVTGAYLGVGVNDVDAAAQYYGVPAGAHVVELYPGYCAEKAGVQVGDIITSIGGQRVESYTELSRALRKFEAGDTTQLTVYRSGQELTIEVTLDEKPQTTDEPAAEAVPDQSQMPQDGSFDEWFNYFDRFYNFGR